MTKVAERVFEVIKVHIETHGYPPTLREVGRAMDMNHAGIWRHYIMPLLDEGRLTWPKDQHGRHIVRGVRTVDVEPEEEKGGTENDL